MKKFSGLRKDREFTKLHVLGCLNIIPVVYVYTATCTDQTMYRQNQVNLHIEPQ